MSFKISHDQSGIMEWELIAGQYAADDLDVGLMAHDLERTHIPRRSPCLGRGWV
jgi:hypothetical protein